MRKNVHELKLQILQFSFGASNDAIENCEREEKR